jgi:5'-methylthioadenosine phosphorylase/purine-nucleoside phosphorylase
MPIHLRAEPGDYAPAVLCPGDPRRASYIAETFFDVGARCVNEERGMLGFTGTFEGEPISVQTTGMGCPSSAIVFEELVQLGARRLIRVGTCGALQPYMRLADTVVALAATPEDTTALVYTDGEPHAPTASWPLVESAVRLARERQMTVHVGPVITSAVFYDPDRTRFARWRERGNLGVEMETAVLYTIAAIRGVHSLTILTVSDLLGADESIRIDDDELKAGVDRMMALACRVAIGSNG